MKTSTKLWITPTASKSSIKLAVSPIAAGIRRRGSFSYLRKSEGLSASSLVEEAAALEQAGAFLGRDLYVPRGEQEDLVGDPLHPTVERVRQTAREVDQPLRELLVGALEIQDHRDVLLEAVGDLLRVVEAPRDHEVHPHRAWAVGRAKLRAHRGRRRLLAGVGPVVELLLTPPGGEPADVRPIRVGALQLLLGHEAVLVPVVLLGDPEVDERPVPDVRESHDA